MVLSSIAKDGMHIKQVDLPSSRMIHPQRAAHRALCKPVAARKQDAMCKDQVNTPRQSKPSDGGIASIAFLGAGGLEITVDCPKVCYLPTFLGNVRRDERDNTNAADQSPLNTCLTAFVHSSALSASS
jgi:hypothetical protein